MKRAKLTFEILTGLSWLCNQKKNLLHSTPSSGQIFGEKILEKCYNKNLATYSTDPQKFKALNWHLNFWQIIKVMSPEKM